MFNFNKTFKVKSNQVETPTKTVVYGENDLGVSISKAFLVMTPKQQDNKFKHVEKRRGCPSKIKLNSSYTQFEFDLELYQQKSQLSFVEQNQYNRFLQSKTNNNFTYSSIQSEQLAKFEAGLKDENFQNQQEQDDYSFISSIINTINSKNNKNFTQTPNSSSRPNCSCTETLTQTTAISFNINMASTPIKRSKYCKECEKAVPTCCFKETYAKHAHKEFKRRKLSSAENNEKPAQPVQKLASHKLHKKYDITTSTHKIGCNAYFKNFLKLKSSKKSKDLNNLTTSTKKSELKNLKIKKVKTQKESQAKSNQIAKLIRTEHKKRLSINNFNPNLENLLIEQNFNMFNQNTALSNNFNQFGQLQVWYV